MKKIFLLLLLAVGLGNAVAQTPTEMQYQLLVLNPHTGLVRASENVNVRIELRKGSSTGTVAFSKDFNVTTDSHGLCTLSLDFGSDIDWGGNSYYLASIVDGEECGAPRLTSVPYAMQAANLDGVITAKELVGTWKGTYDYDNTYRYEATLIINSDKSGAWELLEYNPNSPSNKSQTKWVFTWSLANGDLLLIGTREAYNGSGNLQKICHIFKIDNEHICLKYGFTENIILSKQ